MAGRIRSIKPELFEDEKTAALPSDAFRLFVASLVLADDYGNLRISPKQLEGAVFWACGSASPVPDLVQILTDCGLWTAYAVRGQAYAHVTNWEKHQRVDHPGKARVPDIREGLAIDSRDIRETLAPDLRSPISDLRPPITDLDHLPPPEVPRRRNGAGTRETPNSHETILDRYRIAFKGIYSTDPVITPADRSQIGRLLRDRPEDRCAPCWPATIAEAIALFVADPDPWLMEHRHPLRTLPTRVNTYLRPNDWHAPGCVGAATGAS
jgi:hypothetical protein